MAIILNIETATDIGSVCLSEGKNVLANIECATPFSHSKETTIMIESCLKEAGLSLKDIDAIAISKGPGSYTSLRIGTSIAKGMCYALEKPMIAVDTLQSMALAAKKIAKGDYYIPMIDARRMEVYTAFYDEQVICEKATHALIMDENTFKTELSAKKTIVFAGNGAEKLKKVVDSAQFTFTSIRCAATHLVPLAAQAYESGTFESIAYFEPDYLKPPNITTPKKVL